MSLTLLLVLVVPALVALLAAAGAVLFAMQAANAVDSSRVGRWILCAACVLIALTIAGGYAVAFVYFSSGH